MFVFTIQKRITLKRLLKIETYYEVTNNINFKEIKNFDVTSFSIYELLPSVLKMFIYSISTLFWSFRLKDIFKMKNMFGRLTQMC